MNEFTAIVLDSFGDRTEISVSALGNILVSVFEGRFMEDPCKAEGMFTIEQAKTLRKALKAAIKASEARR